MQEKENLSTFEIQGQDQFCSRYLYTYFHRIEGVEFICDSHGQTFPSAVYISNPLDLMG